MTLEELFESEVPISLINEPILTAREIALRRWKVEPHVIEGWKEVNQ